MERKRMDKKLLLAAVGLVLAWFALPAASLGDNDAETEKADAAEKPLQCEMCKSMMERTKTMTKLKALLVEASGAAEAEGADTAVEKLDDALKLIEEQHKGMHGMMKMHMRKMHKEKMQKGKRGGGMKCPMCGKMMGGMQGEKVVNARCPIMGTKTDPGDVPQDLTREWKGKKVGFCCAGCPAAWDKLSDEAKQKKLDKAMSKSKAESGSGNGHEAHHGG